MSYFLNYRMRLTANVVAHYFWTSDGDVRVFSPSFIPLPERSRLQTISRIALAYSVF